VTLQSQMVECLEATWTSYDYQSHSGDVNSNSTKVYQTPSSKFLGVYEEASDLTSTLCQVVYCGGRMSRVCQCAFWFCQ
jgi:hypothetical protein